MPNFEILEFKVKNESAYEFEIKVLTTSHLSLMVLIGPIIGHLSIYIIGILTFMYYF